MVRDATCWWYSLLQTIWLQLPRQQFCAFFSISALKPATASKRKIFCLQKLTEYYSGTSYCSCFEAPWLCPEPSVRVWQPQEPKNTSIVTAVNVWIELLQKSDNVFIQRTLYEWIDLNHLKIVHMDYKNLQILKTV